MVRMYHRYPIMVTQLERVVVTQLERIVNTQLERILDTQLERIVDAQLERIIDTHVYSWKIVDAQLAVRTYHSYPVMVTRL